MRQLTTLILMGALVSQGYAAPQFITFNDGKLGVNFGGYHAAVGLGGLLGQNGGAGGGLFAEAGTPHGQAARAGLGGAVGSEGGTAGGLYAGATAGGNVKAAAGLAGGMTAEKAAGQGYAAAQAGNHYASSGLGGDASGGEANGFTFSGTKSFGISKGSVDTTVVNAAPVQPITKKVHKEFNFDAANTVDFVPLGAEKTNVEVHKEVQPVIVKEVSKLYTPGSFRSNRYTTIGVGNLMSYLFRGPQVDYRQENWWRPQPTIVYRNPQVGPKEFKSKRAPKMWLPDSQDKVYVQSPPQEVQVIEKHRKHTKPRHHFRKTAYIGGYVGNDGLIQQPQPAIQKRIDANVEASVGAGASADAGYNGNVGQVYTKQVTFQRNPNFFADIFNIPISTLKAVGNFLGNTAGSTSVSVQKSGSIHTDTDIAPKHGAASSASQSAHVAIETPNVSKVIDDILAIPINTLGAVNKFLENNVPARKTVQVGEDGSTGPGRLGPHARRRAAQQAIAVQEEAKKTDAEEKKETSS